MPGFRRRGGRRGRPSPLLSMSISTRRPAGALSRGWRSLVKLLSLLAYFLWLGRVYGVLSCVLGEVIFTISCEWSESEALVDAGVRTSGQPAGLYHGQQ